ncbi:MAG: transcriptional regulator [Stappia sp.]|uniref:helix-turn-helix transcriptional regulator n=1 Tax=Stappia sp. TaxID=1870903 RepID=UPI000C413459|nr:WYL domain-containing protein [Stappia sp.]MAA99340.1 transcriptional regulator [Stappia sp.]MBM19306.1 transcriptional regulator [Stappia sp.]
MNAIERALGLLLLLSGGQRSAAELAERFQVSVRTIYRDVDRLLALGIPVEAERGTDGGYRLARDFLQPPVALTRSETAALLVALALARGLNATPLLSDLDTAQAKLLASLPRPAREVFAQGSRIVGIEKPPVDIFHPEPDAVHPGRMQAAVDAFLNGMLAGRRVRLSHENPYRGRVAEFDLEPHGILFDRDRWYLYGHDVDQDGERFMRADRVREAVVSGMGFRSRADLSVESQIGRKWLSRAMRRWEDEGTVSVLEMGEAQAGRLARDWYYRHATVEPAGPGRLHVRIPSRDPAIILPLARWLGPGAELLSPPDLRNRLAAELAAMAGAYAPSQRQPTK